MPRPLPTFHTFVGQTRLRRYVRKLIRGAEREGEPCPWLLLVAPAGAGKSRFARAIASECKTHFHHLFAARDYPLVAFCEKLHALKHGDVLFVDEIHALSTPIQEAIYQVHDDWRVRRPIDDREGERARRGTSATRLTREAQPIAPHTLIAATTEPGHLKGPLLSRFQQLHFDSYSHRELVAIAKNVATAKGYKLTGQVARKIAELPNATPRSIELLVKSLTLIARENNQELCLSVFKRLLKYEGIDEYGLNPFERRYLAALHDAPKHTASLHVLAAKLGCDTAILERSVEPKLLRLHLIDRTSRGRKLLPAGKAIISQVASDQNQLTR